MRDWRSYGSIASFLVVLALACGDSAHPLDSTGAAGRGGTGGTSSAGGTGGAAGKVGAGTGGAGTGGAVVGSGGAGGHGATGGSVGGRGGGAAGGGAAGSGGTGGAGGVAGRGGAGGGGGTAICGGSTSIPCPTGQVCDYATPNRCGSGSVTGRCIVPPGGCVASVDPVCGCNGQTYLNDCERARARAQLDHAGACSGGGGAGGGGGTAGGGGTGGAGGATAACADCDPASAYCRVTVIGSGSSHLCLPFPAGCGAAPSCACLPVAACSGDCRTGSGGILILSCAGV